MLLGPLGSVPSSGRPTWVMTAFTSQGSGQHRAPTLRSTSLVLVRPDDWGRLMVSQMLPSSSLGRNSEPSRGRGPWRQPGRQRTGDHRPATGLELDQQIPVALLERCSQGFLLSHVLLVEGVGRAAGTRVRVRIRPPSRAKERVSATG